MFPTQPFFSNLIRRGIDKFLLNKNKSPGSYIVIKATTPDPRASKKPVLYLILKHWLRAIRINHFTFFSFILLHARICRKSRGSIN